MKAPKTYTIKQTRVGLNRSSVSINSGTIPELIEEYSYTLECGASWSNEKGNKMINRNPKTIKSLLSNLNNAARNTNGAFGTYYELIED